jgi:hypothetical protein
MRRISVLFLVSAVVMAIPSAVAAQGRPSDPEADSPSGVVYEIPAERGRKDAAPKDGGRRSQDNTAGSQPGGGSSGGGTSGGSTSGSSGFGVASETSIRSENNFGTSSNVPGAASMDRAGSDGDGDAAGRSGGESGDSGRSVGDVAADAARSTAASTEGPSDEVVFPLIVVLVAAGILIGIVASRRAFRGRG